MEIDWEKVGAALDESGSAVVEGLLDSRQCHALAKMYEDEDRFRSRVVMARHGFGRGEYKYFGYPLPDVIAELRTGLYGPLAEIANRWNPGARFPSEHKAFLKRCHAA
ncbi:MAG TPA: 2OG-Fe(II) oxygenase, partial [Gammaproteobacteria bacterium]|nr:2OG-Fe(II) oxygenase [Gammaproteobacteria bacterium]